MQVPGALGTRGSPYSCHMELLLADMWQRRERHPPLLVPATVRCWRAKVLAQGEHIV